MESYYILFKEYLKKTGKKYTAQIEKIIKKIFGIHAHFTIDDLLEKLNDKNIDKESLNVVLEDLTSSGLIRKIHFQDKIFYEQIYGHAHHDHLICIKCNKIEAFKDRIIEQEQERIVKEKGFELLKHSLLIVGICPECLKRGESLDEYILQKEDKGIDNQDIVPLSMISTDEKVKIVDIQGGKHLHHRLISMGINIGETIEVVSNNFQGPFLIKTNNTRIGIGHGITHKIMVKRHSAR